MNTRSAIKPKRRRRARRLTSRRGRRDHEALIEIGRPQDDTIDDAAATEQQPGSLPQAICDTLLPLTVMAAMVGALVSVFHAILSLSS